MSIDTISFGPLAPGDAYICCVMLDDDERGVERAYCELSDDERQRADQFRFPGLRKAFVLSHAVLRGLLAAVCARPPSRLRFGYGPQGKPFLVGGIGEPHYNMAHSGDFAAYALARDRELGIDVEQHRNLPDLFEIAERFFSPREHRALASLPEPDRQAAFFRCWVRKEAYIKARGGGLSIPLDSFQAWPEFVETAIDRGATATDEAQSAWRIEDFAAPPGYSGALAAERATRNIRVHAVQSARDLLERLALPAGFG
jgi:4'-phosphopantetheinyl transferase